MMASAQPIQDAIVALRGHRVMPDEDIIEFFRARAEAEGTGNQAMINAALRSVLAQAGPRKRKDDEPLTVAKSREVLR